MKAQLKIYLNRYAKFNDDEVAFIYNACAVHVYKKRTYLLEQGNICRCHYFILKGLVRQYRVEDNGNENTSTFGIENWWITNLDSFVNQTPSINAIQAIEETTVLQITKSALETLYAKVPQLERVFRIIAQNRFSSIELTYLD